MKKGTFNKVIRIGNLIFKLSTEHTSVAEEMLKLDTKNVKKYESDIRKVGINTSKVYISTYVNKKNLIVQEFVNGMTIQEYLDSDVISTKDKLILFRNVIELYKLSLQDENLCLDWNLNNFIISGKEIYYIDYVPALYKDKIKQVNSPRLEQYKASLLNKQIQLAGIISYAIIPFFNCDKEKLKSIYLSMISCIEGLLNIKINLDDNIEHVYIKKLRILTNYINSTQTFDSFIKMYQSISMGKTAYIKKRKI